MGIPCSDIPKQSWLIILNSWLGSISISHSISNQLPTTSIKSPLSMVNPILPLASINPSTKCSYPRPRRGLPRSRHASAAIAVPPPATSQWCQDRGRPPEWSWHRHNFRTFFWDRNLSKLKTLQISLSRIIFLGFFIIYPESIDQISFF